MAMTRSLASRQWVRSPIEYVFVYSMVAIAVAAVWFACSAQSMPTSPIEYGASGIDARMGGPVDAGALVKVDAAMPDAMLIDATPVSDARPHVPGWYCFKIRNRRSSKPFSSSCMKRIEGCERVRVPWMNGKKLHMTECRHRDKAFCFRVANEVERYEELLCAETELHCIRARAYTKDETGPDTTWTTCDEYD